VPVTVIEADPQYVGGISRTVEYKGFHFDIGGHRFFSKSAAVEELWSELLPDDMLVRPRSSRIYYRGQFFSYPLKAMEALFKLGVLESALCMASYAKSRMFPVRNPKNFQDWVSNQFGSRLFNIFFKTYTEKVWGMDCKEISADWAAQRIKGLSLATAVWHAIKPQSKNKNRDQVIKTLIDSFRYPRKGPGMMWEAAANKIVEMGGHVLMGRKVVGLEYNAQEKLYKVTYQDANGNRDTVFATDVISSAPMRELVNGLNPHVSEEAKHAANSLKYRDFLTVAVILRDRNLFDDNWIYIHEPGVKVGRIQNFKSWSPEMIPDPEMGCYGLEYFCFEGDGLWSSSDESLIELAKTELEKLGLVNRDDVIDGCVVRQPKAYPVYDDDYSKHVETIRHELSERFPGLHLVGRNGMHKYNNQDHAMMTAMLTAENIIADQQLYDVWQVNQDAEYHESGTAGEQSSVSGLRHVPSKVGAAQAEQA
ncbi:MAG TPA: NAD(P)/FAD-dependent oxidoreductase, partial [Blastocatellia bacterium]|nr:NAD(P)/FAD-dependent oxidoreductase [Blastocatellia bacterium]